MERSSVSLMITLAAPLKRPSIILDYYMNHFYNDYRNTKNNHTFIISISGGYSDFLVPPYLTDIKEYNSLHVVVGRNSFLLQYIKFFFFRHLIYHDHG